MEIFSKIFNARKPAETYTHTHTHTCNFLIAIFLSVFSIFSVYSVPSFATNVDNGEDATCDEDTLESPTGPVRLRAEYQPEVINLNWYDENNNRISVPTTSNTCTYDTSISLPPNPTKTGYKFRGWTIVQPFDLGTLDADIDGTDSGYINFSNCSSCRFNVAEYGLTIPGTWGVTFPYGKLTGQALCSTTNGITNIPGTPNEIGGGQFCWCRVTSFNGQPVLSANWVYRYPINGGAQGCTDGCAYDCSIYIPIRPAYRKGLFNQS